MPPCSSPWPTSFACAERTKGPTRPPSKELLYTSGREISQLSGAQWVTARREAPLGASRPSSLRLLRPQADRPAAVRWPVHGRRAEREHGNQRGRGEHEDECGDPAHVPLLSGGKAILSLSLVKVKQEGP